MSPVVCVEKRRTCGFATSAILVKVCVSLAKSPEPCPKNKPQEGVVKREDGARGHPHGTGGWLAK